MNTSKVAPKARIGILVYPETAASVVYGMYDMFNIAGRDKVLLVNGDPAPQLLECLLVSRSTDPLVVLNDVKVTPDISMQNCPPLDIICVPEVALAPDVPPASHFSEEIDWITRRYEEGAILAAACSGAALFSEGGLFGETNVTSYPTWFESTSPQGALVTSGDKQRLVIGRDGTSWLDLTLYLIARILDLNAARAVARMYQIDLQQLGQAPFSIQVSNLNAHDSIIARCQHWISKHYQEPKPVSNMIRQSGLAERTFKRRFQQATGMMPLEYVHAMRLKEAKQLLEVGNLPVEAIANEVGYEDAGYFGRLFRRELKLTPSQYRKRFGSLRRTLHVREPVSGRLALEPKNKGDSVIYQSLHSRAQ